LEEGKLKVGFVVEVLGLRRRETSVFETELEGIEVKSR
jgi:hypothetical protein